MDISTDVIQRLPTSTPTTKPTTTIRPITRPTTACYSTICQIVLILKTIWTHMSRFVAIKANRWSSHLTKNHRGRSIIRTVPILRYILPIYTLSTTNITISSTTTITKTTTITITRKTTKTTGLQNTIFVCNISLICSFSKEDHVLETCRTMHEYLFHYMGF
jgi:hypothetical protein